jgi:hypothetical protein
MTSGSMVIVVLTKRARARRRVRPAGAKKLAISLDPRLAGEVQRAARKRAGGNVSAWLSDAAEAHLRRQAMEAALGKYEAEHGAITEAELAVAERKWRRA